MKWSSQRYKPTHESRFFNLFKRAIFLAATLFVDRDDPKYPEFFRKLLRIPPQDICSHLKGKGPYVNPETELGPGLVIVKDYNVSLHTFVNGKRRIRCNRCGKIVWEGEPEWNKFVEMVKCSSNCPSASEQPGRPLERPIIVTYLDNLLGETNGTAGSEVTDTEN